MAAAAAAALARGGRLPPDTAARVRLHVPSLLSVNVRLPPWQQQQQGLSSNGHRGATVTEQSSTTLSVVPAMPLSAGQPAPLDDGNGGSPSMLSLPLACGGEPGAAGGTCDFTLAAPADSADRQQLHCFAGQLAFELGRARHHLAKQQLEVGGIVHQGGTRPWALLGLLVSLSVAPAGRWDLTPRPANRPA